MQLISQMHTTKLEMFFGANMQVGMQIKLLSTFLEFDGEYILTNWDGG